MGKVTVGGGTSDTGGIEWNAVEQHRQKKKAEAKGCFVAIGVSMFGSLAGLGGSSFASAGSAGAVGVTEPFINFSDAEECGSLLFCRAGKVHENLG